MKFKLGSFWYKLWVRLPVWVPIRVGIVKLDDGDWGCRFYIGRMK